MSSEASSSEVHRKLQLWRPSQFVAPRELDIDDVCDFLKLALAWQVDVAAVGASISLWTAEGGRVLSCGQHLRVWAAECTITAKL